MAGLAPASKPDIDRHHRDDLLKYYGAANNEDLPYDINSKHFNRDMYIQKIIKENSLKQMFENESKLVTEIQGLDSDCQTLVYDHYDKFIAAADIVRKMKEGSVQLEDQISHLQENMAKITASSSGITSSLQGRREKLNHLLGVHVTLKKLEFLFQLPNKIDDCISTGNFVEGVRCYTETAEVLDRYRYLPSFTAIYADCQAAVGRLNASLKEELTMKEGSTNQLMKCVDLLLQLGEPADGLAQDFLLQVHARLAEDLAHLSSLATQVLPNECDTNADGVSEESTDPEVDSEQLDMMQFVDICHETFIGNLLLVISSYKDMFLRLSGRTTARTTDNSVSLHKLHAFINELLHEYVVLIGLRAAREPTVGDFTPLANALDKFYRRLHAIDQLLPNTDWQSAAMQLVATIAEIRCQASLMALKDDWSAQLVEARLAVDAPRTTLQDGGEMTQRLLNDLLTRLVSHIAASVRSHVAALQVFAHTKYTFALRAHFRRAMVREGVVVTFFQYLTQTLVECCTHREKQQPAVLLLLSRMCLDLHTSTVHYLLSQCDAQLQLDDKSNLTPLNVITNEMKEAGHKLLNHYVHSQGTTVSQMLRRSVEVKDWLGGGEPRSVRRVMRTVHEEIITMDTQVGALYEEGSRKERSSDSSRRTFHSMSASRSGNRATWSSYGASQLDNSLVANLNKLWSERFEIFAPVDFTRVSILTGIIKIALKTFLESVRLKTFSKFGLQQVQVDAHFLRTYLWSYVSDEQILNVLLDEVVTSATLRCVEPELMEPRVVEFICEQI